MARTHVHDDDDFVLLDWQVGDDDVGDGDDLG